ncbi:MAG: methyltransferase domain-containing protein [Aliifodinibius sp.]|nr:class I SAM-dependent methyltransferase [Fodinibius sp.]NIV12274.1 methyltransferase domain-containing protein [Fodinibius sp.]NIY25929.1 methyltransferase domain-containing protein [Fodinibius sp.]
MAKYQKENSIEDPFADFAEIYELTHGEKNDDLNLYLEYAKKMGSPILELGSGTGRVTLSLAEAGFTVFGVDLSENMLKIARRKMQQYSLDIQQRVELAQQDMCDLDIANRKFNLILMPYGELAHVMEKHRQIDALSSADRHLEKGGRLIVSMSNWDALEERISYHKSGIARLGSSMPLKYEGVFYDEKNEQTIVRYMARGYDPSVQIAIHVYIHEITDKDGRMIARKTNVLPIRYIFRYEMELLLEKAGFTIEDIFGYYDKSEFRYNSRRMIFVAKKK